MFYLEYLEEPYGSKQRKPYLWRSTGLYAKAGSFVEVTFPTFFVNKGIKVILALKSYTYSATFAVMFWVCVMYS